MKEDILNRFLVSVAGNPKILVSHISLFSAILCCKESDACLFNVNRRKLMDLGKIRSTATYHKCLSDLVEIGSLEYKPSYNPQTGSQMKIH
jgi:hypothetical protein